MKRGPPVLKVKYIWDKIKMAEPVTERPFGKYPEAREKRSML